MLQRLVLYIGGIAGMVLLGFASACAQAPRDTDEIARLNAAAQPLIPARTLADAVAPEPNDRFYRGMVVGLFPWQDEQPDYYHDFVEMRQLGINAVSVNFNWFMDNIHGSEVVAGRADYWNQTPTDEILIETIVSAHHAGLRVMLFPAIYMLNLKRGEWRGRINPARGWDVWFSSYRRHMIRLAQIAEQHRVEALCVGIELISAESHDEHWRALVRELRDVFSGHLFYSSNWDARYKHAWFDDLDFLGMNAYYELSHDANPTFRELAAEWNRIRRTLKNWREHFDKPLIITELGYQSKDGTIGRPWDYFLQGAVDVDEQRLAYESFFATWFEDTDLAGVFFYQWFGEGGPRDDSYTPRGKPAADTMRDWFTRYVTEGRRIPAPKTPRRVTDDAGALGEGLPWPFNRTTNDNDARE